MAIVDGRADLVVSREALFAVIRRDERLFTEDSLADAIHEAFCVPQGIRQFDGLQGEIHRRQHVEISRQIMSKSKAPGG